MAGREIMVKFIIQVIPNYCMSIFLILTTLSDEIQMMMNLNWSWQLVGMKSRGMNWLA